jgi:hypothetical protein
VTDRGTDDDGAVAALCNDVVRLMTHIGEADEDALLDALNDDNEVAVGAMYARALAMGLIELHDDGVAYVRTAREAFAELVDGDQDAP